MAKDEPSPLLIALLVLSIIVFIASLVMDKPDVLPDGLAPGNKVEVHAADTATDLTRN